MRSSKPRPKTDFDMTEAEPEEETYGLGVRKNKIAKQACRSDEDGLRSALIPKRIEPHSATYIVVPLQFYFLTPGILFRTVDYRAQKNVIKLSGDPASYPGKRCTRDCLGDSGIFAGVNVCVPSYPPYNDLSTAPPAPCSPPIPPGATSCSRVPTAPPPDTILFPIYLLNIL